MTRIRGFRVGKDRRRGSHMTRERRLQLLKQAHAESKLQEPKVVNARCLGGQGGNGDSEAAGIARKTVPEWAEDLPVLIIVEGLLALDDEKQEATK